MTYDNSFRKLIAAALTADALSEAEVRSMEWAAMQLNARGMEVGAAVQQAMDNHMRSAAFYAQPDYVAPRSSAVSASKYFFTDKYFMKPVVAAPKPKLITVALMVKRSAKARKLAANKAANYKWAESSFIRIAKREGRDEAIRSMREVLRYPEDQVQHASLITDEYLALCTVDPIYGSVTRPS